MAVGKRERQKRITELVEEEVIETQEELSERLRAEGYEVTAMDSLLTGSSSNIDDLQCCV